MKTQTERDINDIFVNAVQLKQTANLLKHAVETNDHHLQKIYLDQIKNLTKEIDHAVNRIETRKQYRG